jgi:UDP-N-acetylmuramate--alanine ligase
LPISLRLDSIKRIHIIGIGGAGMSALASVLIEAGKEVTGSDLKESAVIERLRLLGASVAIGHHRAENIAGAEVVAHSSAVPRDNVELVAANEQGIAVVDRAGLLEAICHDKRVIAVSGTHGKTTTTSMLALSLIEAGLAPSYIVGAELNDAGASGHLGKSDLLVVEADESDGTFLRISTELAIATNVEPDHLDFYGSFDSLVDAFSTFISRSRQEPVVCVDDPVLARLTRGAQVLSYGFSDRARCQIRNLVLTPHSTGFELFLDRRRLGAVELGTLGSHNALNATAAILAALSVGAGFDDVAAALSRYIGVSRRFQHRRIVKGVRIVDDYAHLPSELRATLSAARQLGQQRVVAVFQPHRYTRTQAYWRELGQALADADVVIITDVYPAGETPIPGVSGELVYQAALDAKHDGVYYVGARGELAETVARLLSPGDLCLTLGAGDITMLESELSEAL